MITFIEASEKDIPLIRNLAEKSWNEAYIEILSQDQIQYMLREMYSENEILNQINTPDYHYFIIGENGVPAGFIGFENHYEENTTKLHRIYLLKEFQGKGLGKEALEFLQKQIIEAGDYRIVLNVNKNNPARKMYESQGYKIYADGVFDIGNGFVMDDFLMEYYLNL